MGLGRSAAAEGSQGLPWRARARSDPRCTSGARQASRPMPPPYPRSPQRGRGGRKWVRRSEESAGDIAMTERGEARGEGDEGAHQAERRTGADEAPSSPSEPALRRELVVREPRTSLNPSSSWAIRARAMCTRASAAKALGHAARASRLRWIGSATRSASVAKRSPPQPADRPHHSTANLPASQRAHQQGDQREHEHRRAQRRGDVRRVRRRCRRMPGACSQVPPAGGGARQRPIDEHQQSNQSRHRERCPGCASLRSGRAAQMGRARALAAGRPTRTAARPRARAAPSPVADPERGPPCPDRGVRAGATAGG